MITLLKVFEDKQCKHCIHRLVCTKRMEYNSFKNAIHAYDNFLRTCNLYIECKDYYFMVDVKDISEVNDDGESRMG